MAGMGRARGPGCTPAPSLRDARAVSLVFMIESPRLPGLTLTDADWLVKAALAVGAERGFPPLAVAVIDVAGEVIALRRSDGGMPMTSRIAVAKARSALIALKPSGLIDLPSGIIESIQHLYHGDFVPWAGGVLVTDGDVILGAAGASGAHALEDEQAVQVAVERWRAHRSHE
jgi:uncharacterized protein GlcG (DUF336 family)